MLQKLKKSQSVTEYAILLALAAAAAMGMQNYIRRGLQARMLDAVVDYVSKTGGSTLQFEPVSSTRNTYNQVVDRTLQEIPCETGSEGVYMRITKHQSADTDSIGWD